MLIVILLFMFNTCLSEVNKTQHWEKLLNQIRDEIKYNFNTSIKVHDVYEKRIEELIKQFSDFREEVQHKSRVERDYTQINGNWKRYKNEKYFILINKLVGYTKAEEVCKSLEESVDSKVTLATIESKEEQNFINRYLYEELGIVQNVWIGITKKELKQEFFTNNKTDDKLTNRTERSPTYFNNRSCVSLRSPFSKFEIKPKDNNNGLWEDMSCENNNLVLCQRMQGWSLSQVQRILFDINNRLENLIPIGFIYTQLPSQPEPHQIWPNYNWSDISTQYSGLFFRVFGGNSSAFNSIQQESSPHLIKVRTATTPTGGHETNISTDDQWSKSIWSGASAGTAYYMSFIVSSDEVRPRNQAIRIWKRVQ